MPKSDPESETYTETETVARREAALKRAFAMPHKPHKEGATARRSKGIADR